MHNILQEYKNKLLRKHTEGAIEDLFVLESFISDALTAYFEKIAKEEAEWEKQ